MFSRRLKTGYFTLEGINSFATVYYFYYLYFFMQKTYGFGNKANLMLAALNGATYALTAWFAGRFAQRFGYFTALKTGYLGMVLALALGWSARSATGQVWAMVLTVVGMSFTWPTLEALVSEGEPRTGLQHMLGVYNVVWAATAALANFSGGAMLEKLGLWSLFYIPMGLHLIQLLLTMWLQSKATRLSIREGARAEAGAGMRGSAASGRDGTLARANGVAQQQWAGRVTTSKAAATVLSCLEAPARAALAPALPGAPVAKLAPVADGSEQTEAGMVGGSTARRFLRMAWLANPFAYIGINTLIAVVPGVARRLDLSTMAAGFCCSTWCFARLGAFALLWRWTRWHYRFRWLLLSYLALVASFAGAVLAPHVAVLVLAQLVFGAAVGLLYYSSLFYSMDRSETKGEHGGIHEAAIGLGNCAGPAVGAATLQLLPQYSQSGTIAVVLLLLCGLGGLWGIWRAKVS